MSSRRLPLLRKEHESVSITALSAAALTSHNDQQSLLQAKQRNDAANRPGRTRARAAGDASSGSEYDEKDDAEDVSIQSRVSGQSKDSMLSHSLTDFLSERTRERDQLARNSVLQAKRESQIRSKKRTQTKERIVREVVDITLPDSAQFTTGGLVVVNHSRNPVVRALKWLRLWPLTLHDAVLSGSYSTVNSVVTRILRREEDKASENGGLSRFVKRRRGDKLYEITEIDGVDEVGRTALVYAVKLQRLDMVKLLINAGADLDVVEARQGNSPLMFAIMYNNTELTLTLLLAGASVELCNFKCTTPLMMACATKSRSINLVKTVCIRALQPVRVNAQDENGWTPLHYAVYAGRANFVTYLVEDRAANTELRDNQRYKPIHLAVFMRNGACEQELLKYC